MKKGTTVKRYFNSGWNNSPTWHRRVEIQELGGSVQSVVSKGVTASGYFWRAGNM